MSGSRNNTRAPLGGRARIENMSVVKKTGVPGALQKSGKAVKKDPVVPPSPAAVAADNAPAAAAAEGGGPAPAFNGAKFDRLGRCLDHPSIRLAHPMKDDRGKLVYQELRANCPSCQATKHRVKKATSLGGGKVRSGRRCHGASSRSRSKSRDPSRGRDGEARGGAAGGGAPRSASRSRKPRKEYDTPFDSKGRCHYHKNVQLAAKKQFGGGWKVLHSICPKCMEDKFEKNGGFGGGGGGSSKGGGDEDRSVKSGYSRKSTRSTASGSGSRSGENANGQFDKNGCCALHTHIQVAKKRFMGSGWKVVRACPACAGNDVDADDYSVKSGKSARSTSSRKSTKSARSAASRGKPGKATSSGRYGALPFDADGYCCRHPNVQLAKKKALGGFKIVHDVCPECTADGGGGAGGGSGRRRPSRRKSGTGRVFDDSDSETSSIRSGKSGRSGAASSAGGSSAGRRKRIRVKNLRTEDEDGRRGRYSGYVDDDHRPNGNGAMKYEDGTVWEGVWAEGSKAHGKTKKGGDGAGKSKF
ncbi:hypothetical protein ACHAWF_016064 [Thalassiosira exigua]